MTDNTKTPEEIKLPESKEETSAEIAYTVELPDDGRQYGFLLPSSQSPRVGDENWAALLTLALHNMDTDIQR